jgi:hypothetical protein
LGVVYLSPLAGAVVFQVVVDSSTKRYQTADDRGCWPGGASSMALDATQARPHSVKRRLGYVDSAICWHGAAVLRRRARGLRDPLFFSAPPGRGTNPAGAMGAALVRRRHCPAINRMRGTAACRCSLGQPACWSSSSPPAAEWRST